MDKKTIRALFDELLGKYENVQGTVDDQHSSNILQSEAELEQIIEEWKRRISEVLDGNTMKLLDDVPERKSETLFDRLEYCRWTLQEHGILDVTQSIHALHILKRWGKDEGVVMKYIQHV